MKNLSLLLLLLCSLSLPLAAQDNTAEPFVLKEPYVINRAPNGTEWTVKFVVDKSAQPQPADTDAPPKPMAQVTTIKSGKYILRRETKDDGSTWDSWCIGEMQILLWPGGKKWIVATPSKRADIPSLNYVDYSKSDFPELEWINAASFVDVETYKGSDCLKFTASVKPMPDDEPVSLTAYINKETRYPIALVRPIGTSEYTFSSATEALELPSIVQQLLAKIAQASQVGRSMPTP